MAVRCAECRCTVLAEPELKKMRSTNRSKHGVHHGYMISSCNVCVRVKAVYGREYLANSMVHSKALDKSAVYDRDYYVPCPLTALVSLESGAR